MVIGNLLGKLISADKGGRKVIAQNKQLLLHKILYSYEQVISL